MKHFGNGTKWEDLRILTESPWRRLWEARCSLCLSLLTDHKARNFSNTHFCTAVWCSHLKARNLPVMRGTSGTSKTRSQNEPFLFMNEVSQVFCDSDRRLTRKPPMFGWIFQYVDFSKSFKNKKKYNFLLNSDSEDCKCVLWHRSDDRGWEWGLYPGW